MQKNVVYRVQGAIWLEGALDEALFQRALQRLVEQHEILQTAFHTLAGMDVPVQVIGHRSPLDCPIINLQQFDPVAQQKMLDASYHSLQTEPFDLAHGPVFRATLFRLSLKKHLLFICLPSLCADASTLPLFVAELVRSYEAEFSDEPLEDEPLQYSDVSAWQDELLELETANLPREFWRKIDLAQATQVHLPFTAGISANHPDLAQQDRFDPRSIPIVTDEAHVFAMSRLADSYHVSVTALLLTCWQISLWRVLDEASFVIGVACDGRDQEDLATALGPYTRFVPLGLSFGEQWTFAQVMETVSQSLQAAVRWQLYFTWNDQGRQAEPNYFPFSFEHQTWPATIEGASIVASLSRISSCIEPFIIKLHVLQVGEHLQLELQYDPRRFSAERADRLSKVLRTLLQGAVAYPQAQIRDLPLLTPQEEKQLISLFQAPRQALPVSGFHQLFEEQARKFPLQTALLSVEETFTYQELNCCANQLARVLQRYGAGPGIPIGLCLPRSARMIVAMLAIFKAGAAYVPLDPESPPARLAYQLQDVQPSLLITEQELSSHLPHFGGQLVDMQTLWAEASQEETRNLSASYSPENLAYVIYTSGSTGMPKGVMIQQRSIINYTYAVCKLLEPEPGWHFATVSTLAADLGNTAIFCALAAGGCLQVLDYSTVTSTEAFARWATRHPIDVLKIVPSHLSALLIDDHATAVLPRKALLLGGETLPAALLERIRGQGASCVIYNHYGPTETTIGVLVNRLSSVEQSKNSPEEMNHPATIPLGRPIANTDVYVLDSSLRIVPVGVTGELYIGGSGLAEGYLHQPEQTAERFLPHPFVGTSHDESGSYSASGTSEPGSRLYRTGDLVRATEQGQIEFIGRRDGQVKLRGYRIELGEIEAVLRQHPNVWDCAVVLREEKEGSSHLVGYIVARKQPVPTETELRGFLRIHLPEYMIPSLFMALKVLPLTANGKVDHRQLPQPEVNLQATRDVLTLPRNPIEEMLLTIWQNLLAMQEIDIHDNFFQLGGHSLLATQVISHVRAVLQIELSIQSLFEHPTIAELAQQVERQVRGTQVGSIPTLLPANRAARLPLSFAQQRLWFLDQLEPGSTTYLIPRAQRIQGALNLAMLERSLAEIVQRHEDLRTTFQEQDGQPVQIIHPAGQFYLPMVDLRGLTQEEREDEAQHLAKQEAQHPCDLAQGPLFRTALLILKEQDYVLLLTMHHIISDGWSNTVFERELTTLYRALTAGQPSPLPPLPVQYADFALWQRQWLQGEILDAQLAYWKQQLADVSPLELPTDHPRSAIQTFQGAFTWLHLSTDLQDELKRISRQESVTLFMLLLAAFQVLLMRYTGQNDISVGTPVANRTRAELEGLIGFFVNTLVLRTDLSDNPSFTEILYRVRKVALEAYAHQDVPFEQLIEVLQPERDLSRSPLFQVMFALQMQGEGAEAIQELQLSPLSTEHTVSRFDLTMNVTSDKYGLHCGIEYNTGLFEEQTIQRLLSHWQILLEGIVATPHATLANLPLLSAAERQTLLLDWNTTVVPVPNQDCFHALFDQQVARTPDAIALVYEEQSWSYQYLQQRSNQLAHYLQQLGVGPEVLVAVLAERCLEQPLAMLAILKAGGGYMPLDPAYPSERLSWMLEDAKPSVLLTTHAATQVPSTTGLRLVCLQTLWSQLGGYSWQNPASEVQLEHTVYIIYTSGSTGTPKGVQVTHRGISNLLHVQRRAFGIQPASRVLQFASLSFDASIWETVMALLTGASLHIAKQDCLLPGPDLINLLAERAISVVTLPPSALSVLPLTPLPALTTLVVAGEACPIDVVENWAAQRHFFNAYGPTETTVCASMAECVINGQKPAIGVPIANTQLYVLDPWLQPVPCGVPGELYIGGVALARGYFKRPDLTAERFLPDPFSNRNGERLYKTGDRVRYRPDGTLEFVGRLDQQIKLRGYRIEIGEIETVLARHPAVREAVVMVQGKAHLAAYVVPSQTDISPSSSDLRRYLQEKLPNYMIPASIVLLGELPLTPNGKIDRRALTALEDYAEDHTLDGENRELTAPRSPMEELLTGIWSSVLGRSRISVYDSFFELGGHSLLAVQLVSRVRAALDIELPLRSLFEFPTVAGFAECLNTLLRSGESAKSPPLVAVSRDQALPLSFAQQRLWFLDQLEPESTAYLMSSARRLQGKLDTRALERSLQELVQRHETLRTTFSLRDGQPVQVIHPMASLPLPLVDLRGLPQEERDNEVLRLVQQEAQCPCDLAQGALLRVCLLRLASQEHVFLFTMHHIISDAWSMQIFEREIITCYQACTTGQPLSLPPLPIQYADYALWQRQWLQGETLNAQLTYWKQQLADIPSLDLPTDHPRPPIQTYRGAFETLHLPITLQDELMRLSRQEGCTLFMTLLAAFQVLLTRYTGQNDISVGTPIANRPHSELEGLIGFFLNTLVMRTDLGGNPSFTEALKRVRKVALEAYSHQDLPFEYLVEALQPERDLSRTPLFQVMFILQQDQDTDVLQELSELQVRGLQTGHTISKFDLTLNVMSDRDGLHCGIEYNTDLFEAETIRRLLAYWQSLLEGIVAAPQTSLIDLPLLSEKERHQLLIDWNATRTVFSTEIGIHELFAQQAQGTPDRIALVWEDTYLSYAALDQYADDLAAYLRHLGVQYEELIGLCVERSPEMLIGLLGILKAHCAYVPLDPTYPPERLAFIETDAQLAIVLTQERLLASMPHQGQQIICLDRDWGTLFAGHGIERSEMIDAQQRAYVIYTSGSTGIPKGVTVSHRNVVNFFAGMDQHIGSEPGIWLAVTSLSFDISVLELLWTLTRGFRVILQSALTAESEDYALATQIVKHSVTHLQCTPSLARILLLMPETEYALKHLQKLLLGGEALPLSLAKQLEAATTAALHNMYGPTETTIWSTTQHLAQVKHVVPLGYPIANTQIYLLDASLHLVPIGSTGEIYIGGTGVARGYHRRPELTAERFIPDPYGGEAGARLYKTGDQARYYADGTLEYLGRADQQVKIRGHRIELAEIESTLERHPSLREAVLNVHESTSGDKQLVAYLVPQGSTTSSVEELRSYLKQHLPETMIPSHFVFLDALPLTPNGKVDRRALPALTVLKGEHGELVVAPRTPIEGVVAEIWGTILERENVSIHDNFFEQGGHSLLATQLVSRIRSMLNVDLPLRSLFEAPTVVGLAKRVELLLRHGQSAEVPPLVPMSRQQKLPLSFAQQRFWFIHQLEPNNAAYTLPRSARLIGKLNLSAMLASFEEIIRRHESLRTRFETYEDQPVQVIDKPTAFPWRVVDLCGLDPQMREQKIFPLLQDEWTCPFNLILGPLLRLTLIRLGQEEHILLLTIHHIIADGWALEKFVGELTQLYVAFAANKPSPLPPLSLQYADFALWQRQWLQGRVLDQQIDYWRQQLHDVPVLDLPTDHLRPPVQTFRGAVQSFTLSADLYKSLLALGRGENVTLFMLLLAAFQVLLMRYSGQDDIAVGTLIANRTHTELEELIGFFANTLVMRTRLSGNPTFRELLQRVREVALGAYTHQDVPFEQLVDVLQPKRDLSRNPLFQVLLLLTNVPKATEFLEELTVSPLNLSQNTTLLDLVLAITPDKEGVRCRVEYNTDLFESATIERMIGHLCMLLAAIVANPDQRLSQFTLLSQAERQQVLFEWNATTSPYPLTQGIHTLFEQQVTRTPEAIAVISADHALSYGELNRRANALSHYLSNCGVGPATLVALCVDRSLDMLVGILGVLKTGAAYIPLDPTYPKERLAFMLSDACAPVLITKSSLLHVLPEASARKVLLDTHWSDIAKERTDNSPATGYGEDLAYVIYTSGSTGQPKGVLATHRATINRLYWMWEQFPFAAEEVSCQKTSLSFVDSIWEIFGPLLRGIRTVILPDEAVKDPYHLGLILAEQYITRIVLVPSLLRIILHTHQNLYTHFSGIKYWVSSGEALSLELAKLCLSQLPHSTFLNLYGSSEVAADATCYLVTDSQGLTSIPIGHPIANTQVYLLDGQGCPVPIGMPGDLYIGGAGLAHGYLYRPELTAERFLPDPFSQQSGARLYRTGDRARYLADGSIEFLGRLDEQVKLRGYRIELGEIESVLNRYPGVRESVAIVHGETPDNQRIVAYIMRQQQATLSLEALRTHLRDHLPIYMIPAQVLELEALPLTPNGKIDRQALPKPDEISIQQVEQAPATLTEELVAGLWTQILGVSQINHHGTFFEQGGHSLLATQLVSRIRAMFNVELSLRSFFESPTVAGIAACVDALLRSGQGIELSHIVPVSRQQELPLSFAQQRLWFLDRLEPGNIAYLMPNRHRFQEKLDVRVLEHSLEEVIRRHESLRTTLQVRDGRPVQVIHPATSFHLPVVDLAHLGKERREGEAKRLIEQEAQQSMDLTRGPLLRVCLLRLDHDDQVLLWTMHHVVSDGWSMQIFEREVVALYQAFASDQPSPLPPLSVQYADFAFWQRQWLQGKVLEAQLDYWITQLSGVPALELPIDYPRPSVQNQQGAVHAFRLSRELSQSLIALGHQQGATLFMTLLAAFQVLLYRYTGQKDIVVGTDSANRTRAEIEGMIGFFVNLLPLRTSLSGNQSFKEVLRTVREVVLGAYIHQETPFELLVEKLAPTRNLDRVPLVQALLVLQNFSPLQPTQQAPTEAPEQEITFDPLKAEIATVKFDLALFMHEQAGQLSGRLNYRPDLFEMSTITTMTARFETMLQSIVLDPDALIDSLDFLTAEERLQSKREEDALKRQLRIRRGERFDLPG